MSREGICVDSAVLNVGLFCYESALKYESLEDRRCGLTQCLKRAGSRWEGIIAGCRASRRVLSQRLQPCNSSLASVAAATVKDVRARLVSLMIVVPPSGGSFFRLRLVSALRP